MKSLISSICAYFQIIHVAIIVLTFKDLVKITDKMNFQLVGIELAFTILIFILSKGKYGYSEIILSLSLSYTLIPNRFKFVSALFFFKILYVHRSLIDIGKQVFKSAESSFSQIGSILLRLVRCTLVEYLFLGITVYSYKMFTLEHQQVAQHQDYYLLYAMLVTSATIGYGDFVPKSPVQIQFFIFAIPLICISFVIYVNAMSPVISQLIEFFTGEEKENKKEIIQSKLWSKKQVESFESFVNEMSKRQAQKLQLQNRLEKNWIAIAAVNYQKQIPLISSILVGTEGKETKFLLSSLIKLEYFPSGWQILKAGDTVQTMFMLQDGKLNIDNQEIKQTGFVFNEKGFFYGNTVEKNVTCTEFTVLWTIKMQDLERQAKKDADLRKALREKTKRSI